MDHFKWNRCRSCGINAELLRPHTTPDGKTVYFRPLFFCVKYIDNSSQELDYQARLGKKPKLIHVNINGLKSKFYDVKQLLNSEKNILLLAVTETKLDKYRDLSNEIEIANYYMLRYDRLNKEGGGTVVYLHNSIQFEEVVIPFNPPGYVECNLLSIKKLGIRPIQICIIYVPPYEINEALFEYITSLCDFLRKSNMCMVLMGDFNINLLDRTDESLKLYKIIKEFDLFQKVNVPTRIASRRLMVNGCEVNKVTSTLLDHIYVSNPDKFDSGFLDFSSTDHRLVYISLTKNKTKCEQSVLKSRRLGKINVDEFEKCINAVDWSFLERTDPDKTVEFYEKQVIAILDKHAPLKSKVVKADTVPWITDDFRDTCRRRDKLKELGANGDYSVLAAAKKLRNLATSQFRILETSYYKNQFNKNNNSNNIWDLFNMLTNFRNKSSPPISKLESSLGMAITDPTEISKLIGNEYVIETATSKLEDLDSEINEYCANFIPDELAVDRSQNVSEEEVSSAITQVRNSRKMEGASPKQIYKLFPFMIKPLVLLFTIIIINMYVPQAMKTSDCFPLYKGKGKRLHASSYRAIFSLTYVTKLFEKILYDRIMMECLDKLNDNQHGFRPRRSCDTALCVFTQDVHNILDQTNGKALAVFIDFKKAFDSVNRTLLMRKLMYEFKLSPYLIKLLCSYFSNRKFRIVNGDQQSDYINIDNGVTPGSCMGPLMFTLFINDIGNNISVNYLLYADDVVLYVDCTNIEEGTMKMRECMLKLEKWCSENSLQINVSKTKMMYFYKPQDYKSMKLCTVNPPKVSVNNEAIEVVGEFKYLGVLIDSKLSMKKHFNHVEFKMNAALSRMYSLRRKFTDNVLKVFLSAFVLSIIDYGIMIWCVQSKVEIDKLQAKIDRFIASFFLSKFSKSSKSKRYYSGNLILTKYYKTLNLNTIAERRKLALIKFVLKFRNINPFKSWFTPTLHADKNFPRLVSPKHNKTLYENSVKYNATKEWNIFLSKVLLTDDTTFSGIIDEINEYLIRIRGEIFI
ncbi:unnamed protein product [Orchesella dallaii]|uniref:Reverse transcriptase domain-containing protein n=1 Tax=Orchesella dallaii TaxID=48710 RepID=A0ABP1RL16_9HEXA